MSSPTDTAGLLGMSPHEPGEALRSAADFDSPEAYRGFLDEARQNPAGLWMDLAGELAWAKPPQELGGAGDFFPEGRLNLSAAALFTGEADGPCLRQAGKELTRQELRGAVGALANRVAALGLEVGSPVLLVLEDPALAMAASLACLHLGLVCVPADPGSRDASHLSRRASAAACRAVLHQVGQACPAGLELPSLELESDWAQASQEAPEPVARPSMAAAFILADTAGRNYSLPGAGLAVQSLSASRHLLNGRGAGDWLWLQTAVHHASFISAWLGSLLTGTGLSLPAETGGELEAVAGSGARILLVQAKRLALRVGSEELQPLDPGPGAQLLVMEGDAVRPSLYKRVREELFGGRLHVTQVLSRPESGGFLAGHHPAAMGVLPASAGYGVPGLALGVLDARGRICPTNYGGLAALEQAVPAMALELQGQEPPIPLGLRVRIDGAGLLWSMGEVKVARQDGELVSASELEAMIAAMDGVDQVAVVRYQAGPGQQSTRAFVKSSGSSQVLDEIRRAVARRFGEAAVPESIQAVSELPYSRTGKLLRSVLRRIAGGDVQGLDGEGVAEDPGVIDNLVRECVDKS